MDDNELDREALKEKLLHGYIIVTWLAKVASVIYLCVHFNTFVLAGIPFILPNFSLPLDGGEVEEDPEEEG